MLLLMTFMTLATPEVRKLPCPVVDGECLRRIAARGSDDQALRMQAAKVMADLDVFLVAQAEQGHMGCQFFLESSVQQPSIALFFLVEEELRKRKGLRVDRIFQPAAWSKRALNITWSMQ